MGHRVRGLPGRLIQFLSGFAVFGRKVVVRNMSRVGALSTWTASWAVRFICFAPAVGLGNVCLVGCGDKADAGVASVYVRGGPSHHSSDTSELEGV